MEAKELFEIFKAGLDRQGVEMDEVWETLDDNDRSAWQFLADRVNARMEAK